MQILDELEAEQAANMSGLRNATYTLIKQLGWSIKMTEYAYSLVDDSGTKPFAVVTEMEIRDVISRAARLFIHKHYLRLMTKGGEHFWAIKNISNTKSAAIAKELSALSKKLGPKLGGSATIIYLDEDKQLYRDELQAERFPIAPADDYKWSGGYTIISEERFTDL